MARQPFMPHRLVIHGRSPEHDSPSTAELEERALQAHSIEARNLLIDMVVTRRERDTALANLACTQKQNHALVEALKAVDQRVEGLCRLLPKRDEDLEIERIPLYDEMEAIHEFILAVLPEAKG